jgi:aryl-alcohol dehydrogenase-like predicted oxidoreductase
MSSFSRLGLGTAQFGLNYGVSNVNGQLDIFEIKKILIRAKNSGVQVLDTAHAYGESEQVLGKCLDNATDFRLVTKTVSFRSPSIGQAEINKLSENFESSLFKLNRTQIDTLMVHHAEDLLVPGGENIFLKMQEWKSSGKIKKIGVSVYDRFEIEQLFDRFQFDVVQLPFSVYDQRLLQDGTLTQLRDAKVEIHARSIFLQGVLLMSPVKLPSYLSTLSSHQERYFSYLKSIKVNPLKAAITFVTNRAEISVAIVGVSSNQDFEECVQAASTDLHHDLSGFAITDKQLIDPRSWPSKS